MNAFPYLNVWLQCLWHLAPPRGLIHVGAGGGPLQYPYASVPRLLAVESDAKHHSRLQAQLQGHPQCQFVQAVVAGEPGPASYHTLSQSNESGLCPVADLQVLWPNIRAVRSDPVEATTLHFLLGGQELDGSSAFNWAVIDCLPAGEVLSGAGTLVSAWDVVVVRALKEAPSATDPAGCALSVPALRQQLSVFGLDYVAMEEENHPQIVRALFVRKSAQKLAQENSKLIANYADLARARDELGLQKEAEVQAKNNAIAQRDSLAQENSKLIVDYAEIVRARDELGLQKDAAAKAKTEATQQRDEQTRLANELREAAAAHVQDTATKQIRIQQLEAENQEYAARQQLMQEELIKAAVQIDLIKDLLLREPGL